MSSRKLKHNACAFSYIVCTDHLQTEQKREYNEKKTSFLEFIYLYIWCNVGKTSVEKYVFMNRCDGSLRFIVIASVVRIVLDVISSRLLLLLLLFIVLLALLDYCLTPPL